MSLLPGHVLRTNLGSALWPTAIRALPSADLVFSEVKGKYGHMQHIPAAHIAGSRSLLGRTSTQRCLAASVLKFIGPQQPTGLLASLSASQSFSGTSHNIWHQKQRILADSILNAPARSIGTKATASSIPLPSSPGGQGYDPHGDHDELRTLNVAISVNAAILLAKLWVHLLTGSSAMLAEALHSLADVGNQALLRVGVMKAKKGPTEMHPYGYMRDRFVWSLISAVGIFFLGAGASVLHGIHTLTESHTLELKEVFWSYMVLGISAVLEGYSLWVAYKSVAKAAKARGVKVKDYIVSGADPTTVAVLMEDGGAVLGLGIAGMCTALAHATGNFMYDAAGSVLVGLLLGAIATFLVQRNRQLLIGRSMAPDEVRAVVSRLSSDPVVASVSESMSEEIGPGIYRFKAEVAWDGERLVERYLKRCGSEVLVRQVHAAAQRNDKVEVERLLKVYGRALIGTVGVEVDRIEADLQKLNPGIRYVDLETDRGRHGPKELAWDLAGLDGASPAWQTKTIHSPNGYECILPSDMYPPTPPDSSAIHTPVSSSHEPGSAASFTADGIPTGAKAGPSQQQQQQQQLNTAGWPGSFNSAGSAGGSSRKACGNKLSALDMQLDGDDVELKPQIGAGSSKIDMDKL